MRESKIQPVELAAPSKLPITTYERLCYMDPQRTSKVFPSPQWISSVHRWQSIPKHNILAYISPQIYLALAFRNHTKGIPSLKTFAPRVAVVAAEIP